MRGDYILNSHKDVYSTDFTDFLVSQELIDELLDVLSCWCWFPLQSCLYPPQFQLRVNKKCLIQSINRFIIWYSALCTDTKYLYEWVCSMESTYGVVQLFEFFEMEQEEGKILSTKWVSLTWMPFFHFSHRCVCAKIHEQFISFWVLVINTGLSIAYPPEFQ